MSSITELIKQIKLKADSIPMNTKENRRVKGAYIDCLIMVQEASTKIALSDVTICNCKVSGKETNYDLTDQLCPNCW